MFSTGRIIRLHAVVGAAYHDVAFSVFSIPEPSFWNMHTGTFIPEPPIPNLHAYNYLSNFS